ncbi:hypothetical protein [Tepidibacter mesophilus]|uniref:hypothetical protein n=1 Tax=Tepidibacter mesophilus TaxID=655607 RepID=UPI000C07668A|nr:hypothetical protein [Tepidibacter mesophilus]
MIDILLCIISILCLVYILKLTINAFNKNKYNPCIFNIGNGLDFKLSNIFWYFGVIIPTKYIKTHYIKDLLEIIILIVIAIVITVLNIKSYNKLKQKNILIQTGIFNVFIITILYIIIGI